VKKVLKNFEADSKKIQKLRENAIIRRKESQQKKSINGKESQKLFGCQANNKLQIAFVLYIFAYLLYICEK